MPQPDTTPCLPELWGGIECTCTTIEGRKVDLVETTGHANRLSDLQQISDLGIKALRYPVVWERAQDRVGGAIDWRWTDSRLGELNRLGLEPIAGLMHHGNGPVGVDPPDPEFPDLFADWASKVAERYPWLRYYVPINEPVTTARFSCLYGFWGPHIRDSLTFVTAVINKCRAIQKAMKAIRKINPQALFVLTDDFAKTFSTPALAYQASFDNERRWLGLDILCGRVDSSHPLWCYLLSIGTDMNLLRLACDDPCPPDIIGIDYYVTSERFLDQRVGLYPICTRGGNGRHEYCDVEAVRVRPEGLEGPEKLGREIWDKYGIEIAFAEVHIGSPVEEQIRWFAQAWKAASALLKQGVRVKAVTSWALLGSRDWDSLLIKNQGHYEAGAFDVSSGVPRRTELADLLTQVARSGCCEHPALESPGWWITPDRIAYPVDRACANTKVSQPVRQSFF